VASGIAIAKTETILVTDPEGDTVSMNVLSIGLPAYVTYTGLTFSVKPPAGLAFTTIPISYKLTDGVNTIGPYTFTISVVNLPPVLYANIADFSISVGTPIVSKSLTVSDPEGDTVTISDIGTLPGFITRSGFIFTFNVGFNLPGGTHTI
jgi:hypothetical protein